MFVARELKSNPTPEVISDLKFALENAPAQSGNGEAALVRVEKDNESKVYLVRAPGAAEKGGKVLLQTDKGVVEGYALATAMPANSTYDGLKTKGLYAGATVGATMTIAFFAPVVVPLLEYACMKAGVPVAVASGAFYCLDALASGSVLIPFWRGQTPDKKISHLANATIDAHLADNAEPLNVVQISR